MKSDISVTNFANFIICKSFFVVCFCPIIHTSSTTHNCNVVHCAAKDIKHNDIIIKLRPRNTVATNITIFYHAIQIQDTHIIFFYCVYCILYIVVSHLNLSLLQKVSHISYKFSSHKCI